MPQEGVYNLKSSPLARAEMPTVKRHIGSSLSFKRNYLEKVMKNEKTVTIRWGLVKPLRRIVYVESQGMIYGLAMIRNVRYLRFSQLRSATLANRDGFANVKDMVQELRKIYPFVKKYDWFTIIEFEIIEKLNNPVPKTFLIKKAVSAAREALVNGLYKEPTERLALANIVAGSDILETIENSRIKLSRLLELLSAPTRGL